MTLRYRLGSLAFGLTLLVGFTPTISWSIQDSVIRPTNTTASRLVATDAGKKLVSVSNLCSWVNGAAGETVCTDNGDGTATISLNSAVVLESDVDDTPVDNATSDPISSNWAYDHDNDTLDQHSQYFKLGGRSGGQTAYGGTGAGDNATISSTFHATKGKILFGTSAYDEVNNRIGIGTDSPGYDIDIVGDGKIGGNLGVGTAPSGTIRANINGGAGHNEALRVEKSLDTSGASAQYAIRSSTSSNISSVSTVQMRSFNLEYYKYGTGIQQGAVFGNKMFFSTQSASTVSSIYGASVGIEATTAGSTITNAYHYNVEDRSGGSGAITNSYGLYINDLSYAINSYGVYQVGADDINYFGGKVGIGETSPAAKLHVNESDNASATPVAIFEQADVDEPFLKVIGTAAAADLTRSIVDAADVGTATVAGYVKIEVQDDGNQITDQDYFIPVYTLAP